MNRIDPKSLLSQNFLCIKPFPDFQYVRIQHEVTIYIIYYDLTSVYNIEQSIHLKQWKRIRHNR